MQSYFQHPSGAGLRYPRSGQVVGAVAEFMRLKGYLKDDWSGASYKTVQRYFQGDSIKQETADAILDALLDSVLPAGQEGPTEWPAKGIQLRAWAKTCLSSLLREWDMLAAECNASMFAVVEPRWLPYPLLRLLVLDFGIRWAGYLGMTKPRDSDQGKCMPPLLAPDALRVAMDEARLAASPPLTIEQLAERVDVSMNSMEAWRQGKSLPTNDHLVRLAAVLAKQTGQPIADVELSLRMAVAGAACSNYLTSLCGEDLAQDFTRAMAKSARMTLRFLRDTPIPLELWDSVMQEVIEYGARATVRHVLCPYLAEQCGDNVESAADFMALCGHWYERMNYWAQRSRPPTLDEAKSQWRQVRQRMSVEQMQRCSQMFHEQSLRLTEFLMDEEDWRVLQERFPHSTVIRGEDIDPVGTYTKKGLRAHSLRDYATALDYFETALEYKPDDAYLHYLIGGTIGLLVSEGHLDLVDEAVHACREAARLDPNWNSPPTEIGIILSNAGRIEEAEDAFQRAEHVAAGWSHFHLTRANNLMWLERFSQAADSYKKACQLRPADIHAWFGLAAAQYRLGDMRGLQKTARQIRDLGGPEHSDASRWLDYVPRMANPILRRADYRTKIGRNEACPCASGKKYKRCCGR